jgi:hypothetical protein
MHASGVVEGEACEEALQLVGLAIESAVRSLRDA